jgi:hypothetical protein
MRNDLKKLRTNFTPLYHDATKKCDAWYAMNATARAAVMEIKLLFNRDTEGPVGMSARQLARLLGISTRYAVLLLRQIQHYGFLVKMIDGHLGLNGKGIATQWRLTDEPYQGKPATLDFKRWDGTLFKAKPQPKKTKTRIPQGHRPVSPRDTPRSTQGYRVPKKPRKTGNSQKHPPVSPRDTFLRSSPSAAPGREPESARAEPVPAAAASGWPRNAQKPDEQLDPEPIKLSWHTPVIEEVFGAERDAILSEYDDLPTCLRRGHPDCWVKD